MAQLTAEEIIGADVRNADGEVVATVDDMISRRDGKAESVAAKFGGFLGFGTNTVLLKLDEVEFMQNDSGTVALRTAITPESLEGRPYTGPTRLPADARLAVPGTAVLLDRSAARTRSFPCRRRTASMVAAERPDVPMNIDPARQHTPGPPRSRRDSRFSAHFPALA